MRKMMYKVTKADGTIFDTSSYVKALEKGNRIIESYLVPIENLDGSKKEYDETHIEKVDAYLRAKRG